MSEIKLRDYQQSAVDETISEIMFSGADNLVIEAPTAFGKSITIAGLCKELDSSSIVILVNITELIDQIADHLDLLGLEYSILKANRDNEFDSNKRIQLVMAQTLYARLDKIEMKTDVIIQDEYHREYSTNRTLKILSKLKPTTRIGLSATPYDRDGFLLKDTHLIETTTVKELESKNFLSEIKYYIPKWAEEKDYSNVSKTGADYNISSLDEQINSSAYVKNAIEAMNLMNVKNKKSIIFCSSIEQCEHITAEMKNNGFEVESIHSDKNSKENEAILTSFKNNEKYKKPLKNNGENTKSLFEETAKDKYIKCLVSVAKLSTGFDVKDIDIGIIMRPTMVRSLYVQMVGRICRVSDGKKYGEILDLAKCVSRFGFHSEPYAPLIRTGDFELDKKIKEKSLKTTSMPFLELSLDGSEPQEIDLNKYRLIIKKLEEKERKIAEYKADISNWKISELANMFNITTSFNVLLSIGAEIMTRKYGKPISKAGREYSYDPKWIGEDIPSVIEEYPECESRFLKAYKTRTRNIIKEGKNFNSLKFFIQFLKDRYEEENAEVTVPERNTDDYTSNNIENSIEVEEDPDIPF